MATAGRILILPKGDWASGTTYEMLDLVSHNGTSWLAKKTSVGIEPSDATNEYWQNMFDVENVINEYTSKVYGSFKMHEANDLTRSEVTEVAMSKQIDNGISLLFIKDVDSMISNLPPHVFVLTRNWDNYRADALLTNDRVESVTFNNGIPNVKFSGVTYPYLCIYKLF
jgi:hypothetical protein